MKRYILLAALVPILLAAASPKKAKPAATAPNSPTSAYRAVRPRIAPRHAFRTGLALGLRGMQNPVAFSLGGLLGAAMVEGYARQIEADRREADVFADGPTHPEEQTEERTFAPLAAPLAPEPVVLAAPLARFTSDPIEAEVRIDGVYAGTTPTPEIQIAPGAHAVTIARPGYQAWTGSLDGTAGNTAALNAQLHAQSDLSKPRIAGY